MSIAAALAVTTGMALSFSGDQPVAEATNATFFPQTGFEIDGNLAFDAIEDGDWLSAYGPGLTPSGYPTTGVYYNERTPDPCNDPSDDIASGGIDVGQGPVWPFVTGSPNNKTDLLALRIGAEKVSVPAGTGAQINDILYVGFETCNKSSGTFNLTVFIEGGDGVTPYLANGATTGSTDDYLIIFDFQGGGVGSGTLYDFNGTNWVLDTNITAQQFQPFINPDRTVGEVALNLTSLGIPSDGTGGAGTPNEDSSCKTITVSGQAATPTGGSLNSQVKDLIDVDPLQISNCGAIDITKLAADGAASATDPFHYVLSQIDSEDVHDGNGTLTSTPAGLGEPDGDRSEIDADIALGTTHNWVNVLSQPDYGLIEDTLPTGWELQTITCTTTDLFDSDTDGDIFDPIDVVVYDQATGGATGNLFLIAPAVLGNVPIDPANCTITNDALGITIVKDGVGTAGTTFTFDIDGGVATDLPVVINGDAVFQTLPATGTYTITEDDINALDVGDAEPDWTLANLVCVDNEGAVAPTYSGSSATVVVDGADDDIVCTFTNNQAARIDVSKVTDPTDTPDVFDFTFSGPGTAGPINDLGNGDSGSTGDITPGTYTITEISPASDPAWVLSSADCGAIEADGVSVIVTVAAGDIASCEFTNQQQGAIVIDKEVVEPGTSTIAIDQDATFTFTGAVDDTITTTAGATADGDELIVNPVMPGSYTVDEDVTATPGYTLEAVTCTDDDSTQSGDGAAIEVGSGETVNCTFANSRNQATFTIQKAWGAGTLAGEIVALTASATGPTPLSTPIATTATSPSGAAGTNSFTVYSGQTVTFSESFVGAAGDGYTTSLDCGALGTMVLTPNGDNRGGTLAVGNTPSDVTCTLTNTPKVAGVTLQKNWDANSSAGDTATLTLATAPTDNSDNAVSTAPDAPLFGGPADATDNSAFVAVVAGDTVTFGEDLGAAAANYTTQFACTGATNTPVEVNAYEHTLLIDTADVAGGASISCSYTNTRIEVDVTLAKDWDDAIVNDAVTLSATGSDTTPIAFDSVADAADETDTSGTFTVYAGETVSLAEAWNTGDSDAYDTSLTCVGGVDDDVVDGDLTIDPADSSITCTWVNARRSVNVVVAKSVAPAGDDGAFDLSINGNVEFSGAVDGDASAAVSVFVGDTVSVAEVAAAASPALENYTSALTCDNGIAPAANTGTSGNFVVPSTLASAATVTCTFTNTRNEAALTVLKGWGTSPVDGDEVDLTIDGGLFTPTAGNDTNDANDTNDTAATSTVFGGETIDVAEAFGAGSDSANYDTSLECVDASGVILSNSDLLSGQLTVAAAPTAITCTFTNQRKSATLVVDKAWSNAKAGDTADVTIAGVDTGSPATGTSTADLPIETDSSVATLTVWAGETVDVDEVIGLIDPQDAPRYDSTLNCPGKITVAGRAGSIPVTAADEDTTITCTFRNVRRGVDLTLTKDWASSPANGDTVGLYLDGGLIPATNGNPSDAPASAPNSNDDTANDTDASVRALVGDTITLSEGFVVGDAVNYDTTFTCVDGSAATVAAGLVYTDGAMSATLDIAADLTGPVSCTYTNTRKSAELTFDKAWAKPEAGDTTTLSITGTDSDSQLVTAPATTPVATSTVYAGETVTLAETFGTNTATYDVTAFTCTDGTLTWDGTPTDVDGTLLVTAADIDGLAADTGISCTITNTAQRGTVIVVKNVEGTTDDAAFDFAGTWLPDPSEFSIQTAPDADAITGSVTYTDVLVGDYTVTETDPTPNFDGTTVDCGAGEAGPVNGELTSDFTLANGGVITCTFTNTERSTVIILKDARPDAATDFAFTGDLGAFTLDDDADATLSNQFTSALLNAEPGSTYTVAETATPGWQLDLANSSCSNGDTFAGSGVVIDPAPGTTVTCTFVNNALPAGLTATKAVSGVVGAWGPFEFTLTGGTPAATFTGDAAQNVDSVDPAADWTDLVEGETYTLTENDVPGYETGATFTCAVIRPGADGVPADLVDADDNTAGFQFIAEAGGVYSCEITNVAIAPTLTVDKTTIGDVGTFTFDVTPTDVTYPVGPLTATTTAVDTAASSATVDLQAGVGYSIAEQLSDEWVEGTLTCTATPADGSDAVAYVFDATTQPGDVISCAITNIKRGEVTVDKTATTAVTRDGDSYSVTYEVTVGNESYVDELYTVVDTPDMADNVTIQTMVVTGPGLAVEGVDIAPAGGTVITDATIAARAGQGGIGDPEPLVYTVVTTFAMAPVTTVELVASQPCLTTEVGLEAGNGAYNGVSVTFADFLGETTNTDDACVDLPTPNVDDDKVVVGDGATYLGDNQWTVVYDVTVTNLDPSADVAAGPAEYDLTDTLAFGPGTTVTAVTVTTDPDTLTPVATFDGEGNASLAEDATINAGETHTYTITVDVTIVPTEGTNGDCTADGGLRNSAGLSVTADVDTIRPDREACASFSTLTLIKQLSDDVDGGNADLADFTLTATLDGVEILSGHTLVTESVPAGDYVLAETQLPGYVSEGYTCGAATMDGQIVTVASGASVVCTIINDDLPVDLELTKNDDGITAIAGGVAFDYTIAVQNIGGRDADLGEAVTVTDTLPAPLQWVSFPDTCSQAAQVLTCSVDPALLTAGGAPVVITVTVRAPADAPSGTYVNKATVTTSDDPVCTPVGQCTPPPCTEAAANNNVDCEETPVDRAGAIQIVKTDDVADGATVQPGDTFSYGLSVTNTGQSTILPDLVVDDDLPADLTLVSVAGGTGWTCNSSDPIECTYGPALLPGATAPTITVTVQVAAGATASTIVNTAIVTGAVDRDCTDRIIEGLAVPACDEVTDQDSESTPLQSNADLAIVKTASISGPTAPGNSFRWVMNVTNNGPATAFNVEVGDIVPSSLTVDEVTSAFFDCSTSGNTVTCTRPSMAVGESGQLTILVTVNATAAGGAITNVATVDSDTPDLDLTNNSDDATVDVVVQAPPTTVVIELPKTGTDATGQLLQFAFGMLLMGGFVVLVTRRRREVQHES